MDSRKLSFVVNKYTNTATKAAIAAATSPTGPVSSPNTLENPLTIPPALENKELIFPTVDTSCPTTINTGPIAAAIPAIIRINCCVLGDISENLFIISAILLIIGVIIGNKFCPSAIHKLSTEPCNVLRLFAVPSDVRA